MAAQTQEQMAAQIRTVSGFLDTQNQAFAGKEADVARNSEEMLKLREQEIDHLLAKLQTQRAEMADRRKKTEEKQEELDRSTPWFLVQCVRPRSLFRVPFLSLPKECGKMRKSNDQHECDCPERNPMIFSTLKHLLAFLVLSALMFRQTTALVPSNVQQLQQLMLHPSASCPIFLKSRVYSTSSSFRTHMKVQICRLT